MRKTVRCERAMGVARSIEGQTVRVRSISLACFLLTLSLSSFCFATPSHAAWTHISPNGGTVNSLAIDPADSQIVYAGTLGGGVFKTTNGGTSWKPVNTGLANTDIRSLAIDPTDTRIVYAGAYSGGVFKTTNGGVATISEGDDTEEDQEELED